MTIERGTKLSLESKRLLVSGALGTNFCNLLEQEAPIGLGADREQYISEQLELGPAKKHLEIQVDTVDEAAFLLRVYRPEMILGSQKNTNTEIINQIGSQLGISTEMSSTAGISDRLVGRNKVAIVVLNIDSAKLDKKFKKLPENGILVIVGNND